jgi:hypothetical protein
MKKSKIGIRRAVLTIMLVLLWTTTLYAQEMVVPVKLQLALLLKVLTFDRNLNQRAGDELVIAICYQQEYDRSVKVKDEILSVMQASPVDKIGDLPLRFSSIDMGKSDLEKAISKEDVDVLYFTPLRDVSLQTIASVSRAKKTLTLTGVPDYVKSGLAVGIGTKEEKPLIIINLPAAKAEGADFSSQLLKLAEVIQ